MSNFDDLTIGEARERLEQAKKDVVDLSALFGVEVSEGEAISSRSQVIGELGRSVIVRSREMGVVFGEYDGNDGANVHLKNARQMWSWTALKGGTLLDCATHGVSKGKISSVNDAVTVFNACGLIDCTSDAAKSIRAVDVSFK